MNHVEYLIKIGLPEFIKEVDLAVTKKYRIDDAKDGAKFDAWYTNKPYVLKSLSTIGESIGKKLWDDWQEESLAEGKSLAWNKFDDTKESQALKKRLEDKGTAPTGWEEAPDGTFAGMAIVLAGWIANLAAGRTIDDPKNISREFFEKSIRPLIHAAMDLGIEMAINDEGK